MNQMWRTHLQSKVEQLKGQGQYRNLHVTEKAEETWLIRNKKKMLNLASNNYLGLAGDERLKEAAIACTRKYGTGATASRLVVGNYPLYEEVERSICDWKGTERALIVNSGYTANVGAISTLACRHDMVFSDKLNHASIVDGIILSGAEHKRYRHNDLDHLEKMLQIASPEKRKLIVTDTVFSMDGDIAYLRGLVQLKEKYGAIIIVDEAHASGIYGIGGAGLSHIEKDIAQKIDIHMGTFSKALGCYGAYLTGDSIYIEYLQNMMRSLIFTTALPPGTLGASAKAIEIVKEDNERESTYREWCIFQDAFTRSWF